MNSHRPKTQRVINKRFDLHNKQTNHAINKKVEQVSTELKKKAVMGVKIAGEYGLLNVYESKRKDVVTVKAVGEYGFLNKELPPKLGDYDVAIIISSYDRYEKAVGIINQLLAQESRYTFKIILLNDGSTDNRYLDLNNIYPNITLLNNTVNNGKYKYWVSINILLKEVLKYEVKTVLQIDDDYLLCENFLNILLDKFFEIKKLDNRYCAIALHRTHPFIPNQWGLDINWVDGGTLFDNEFIRKIKEIDEISPNIWVYDDSMSSGVWKQVSNRINQYGCLVYRFDFSLVKHMGNDDSKMNKIQRDLSPINTYNFLNDSKNG